MNRGVCMLLLCFTAPAGDIPGGYLPRVGPAPLRFEGLPQVRMTLPPLLMQDPAPNPGEEGAEFLGPPAPPPKPAASAPSAPETNSVAPRAAASVKISPDPAAGDILFGQGESAPPLTPQMLVQFFQQQGTNRQTTILAPVGFTPPPPPQAAPSSTATYATPPR